MTIKKGDTVQIMAGKDRGKSGMVQAVLPILGRVVVEGVNIRKHHLKPKANRPKGGIIEIPAPLQASNVMILCPHCSKPTRIRTISSEQGKFRACVHCANSLDK